VNVSNTNISTVQVQVAPLQSVVTPVTNSTITTPSAPAQTTVQTPFFQPAGFGPASSITSTDAMPGIRGIDMHASGHRARVPVGSRRSQGVPAALAPGVHVQAKKASIDVDCVTSFPKKWIGGSTSEPIAYTDRESKANLLIKPTEDLEFKTDYGTIRMPAKSVVLISSTPKSLSIYDLHDSRTGVEIAIGKQHVKLWPGHQATVCCDAKPIEGNSCAYIRHADVQRNSLPDGHFIVTSKFSIASALELIEPLKHDQTVLKTAAIQRMTYGSF
jgi:hypothetical protein